jgi:hypothetical protein
MFDPTIYENIKVVVEGSVYDLDLAGVIVVTNRVDRIELATMSRYYSIQFEDILDGAEEKPKHNSVRAELRITASADDLRAEILEQEDQKPGCSMSICFYTEIAQADAECSKINEILQNIWQNRPDITQKLSFVYGDKIGTYSNEVTLDFGRKIDEEQVEDIKPIVDLMHHSIKAINEYKRNC